MPGQSLTAAYHSLMAAVIDRAIADLKGIGPKCRKAETDQAMAFVLSDTCEAYCLELNIDCEMIREKAAALYQKIITKEKPPRKPYGQRRLSGDSRSRVSNSLDIPAIYRDIKNRRKSAVRDCHAGRRLKICPANTSIASDNRRKIKKRYPIP